MRGRGAKSHLPVVLKNAAAHRLSGRAKTGADRIGALENAIFDDAARPMKLRRRLLRGIGRIAKSQAFDLNVLARRAPDERTNRNVNAAVGQLLVLRTPRVKPLAFGIDEKRAARKRRAIHHLRQLVVLHHHLLGAHRGIVVHALAVVRRHQIAIPRGRIDVIFLVGAGFPAPIGQLIGTRQQDVSARRGPKANRLFGRAGVFDQNGFAVSARMNQNRVAGRDDFSGFSDGAKLRVGSHVGQKFGRDVQSAIHGGGRGCCWRGGLVLRAARRRKRGHAEGVGEKERAGQGFTSD